MDGNGDIAHIFGVKIAVHWLMIQGDKTNVVPWEPVIQIVALIAVVPKRTGKVFHDYAIDSPVLDVRQHPLKIFTFVVGGARNTIVHIFVYYDILVAVLKPGNVFLDDCPLVGNALGFVVAAGVFFG